MAGGIIPESWAASPGIGSGGSETPPGRRTGAAITAPLGFRRGHGLDRGRCHSQKPRTAKIRHETGAVDDV